MARSYLFRDRADAGQQLARQLANLVAKDGPESAIVLGLPRGGVVVAAEVARLLGLPLDIWAVRKVGAPRQPELGVGAVAEGGELFLNSLIVTQVGATLTEIEAEVRSKLAEVHELVGRLRRGHPPPEIRNRTVLLIDDGIATGGTVRVAARALRKRGARRVILAAPVAALDTLELLRPEVDDLVCLKADPHLGSVSTWYLDFTQTTDQEVIHLLEQSYKKQEAKPHPHP